jgi:hypothetical protein
MAVKTEINAACLFSFGEIDFEGKKNNTAQCFI